MRVAMERHIESPMEVIYKNNQYLRKGTSLR